MKYIIYKITNLVNNKYYIGMHRTENINDNYMGSGKLLKRAIKKYGIEYFSKEILFIYDNEREMCDKEAELVNNEFCKLNETYNVATGGSGGDTLKFHPNLENIKKKMRDKWIGRINTWSKGSKRTEEEKKHFSNIRKGCKTWNKGINHLSGYKWMNDGIKNTRICKEEIEKYLLDGYKIGRIPSEKILQHLKNQNDKKKGKPSWNSGMKKDDMIVYKEAKYGI